MQEHHAQNAEMLCSKFRNVMLKMQKRYMLKMQKCYAQNAKMLCSNAETLCSKCGKFQCDSLLLEVLPTNVSVNPAL